MNIHWQYILSLYLPRDQDMENRHLRPGSFYNNPDIQHQLDLLIAFFICKFLFLQHTIYFYNLILINFFFYQSPVAPTLCREHPGCFPLLIMELMVMMRTTYLMDSTVHASGMVYKCSFIIHTADFNIKIISSHKTLSNIWKPSKGNKYGNYSRNQILQELQRWKLNIIDNQLWRRLMPLFDASFVNPFDDEIISDSCYCVFFLSPGLNLHVDSLNNSRIPGWWWSCLV